MRHLKIHPDCKQERGRSSLIGFVLFLIQDDSPAIPDDFYYELDEFVSKPFVTEDSGLPSDLLTLQWVVSPSPCPSDQFCHFTCETGHFQEAKTEKRQLFLNSFQKFPKSFSGDWSSNCFDSDDGET